MTLRLRLIAGYTTMVMLTIVGLLIAVRLLMEHAALRQLDIHHAVEAAEFNDMTRDLPASEHEARWCRHMELDSGLYKFFLHAADGRIVHRSDALKAVAPAYLLAVPDGRADLGGELGACRITSHDVEGYRLRIITPLALPLAVTESFYEIGALLLVLAFAGSLVAGAVFSRWALRPLVRMEDAARRIGRGTPDERIPADIVNAGDEPARLAALLNDGYDRMQTSVERLRRFSAEVSHELRTPLSVVRLNAERMRDTPGAPESIRQLAAEQVGEIERLNRFITNLLGFARLDSGAVRMEPAPVDLRRYLADFAEDAALLCEDAERRFELAPVPEATVRFDPVWVRQILFNLLSNALRATPRGGLIRIDAELDVAGLHLSLSDEGPGVPPERLEAMFERYVRFGEERGPAEGVGLGLSICRSIAELHGGSIAAVNRTDRAGLRVTLHLPPAHEELA